VEISRHTGFRGAAVGVCALLMEETNSWYIAFL